MIKGNSTIACPDAIFNPTNISVSYFHIEY